jgi:uncharacterized FlaG/YvyC family protein
MTKQKERKHHHKSCVSDFDSKSSKTSDKDLQKAFEKLNDEALKIFKNINFHFEALKLSMVEKRCY